MLEEKCNTLRTNAEKYLSRTEKDSGDYSYERQDVQELASLLCRRLENKPSRVDAGRTFNAIKKLWDCLNKWDDNPEHFYPDMRMLLAIAATTNWFTEKQSGKIDSWMREKGWD